MRELGLTGTPFDSPEEVVGALGAVQSQDYAPGKWADAMRARGLADADVERAFAEGRILRTHILRPTWHFVLPADIRWMLELTGPRVHAKNAFMYRQVDADADVLRKARRVIVRALGDGRHLTRRKIESLFLDAGITATGFRTAYLLMHAELDGIICSGAPSGRQQTYALLDERAPAARSMARDDALAELTRRYFRSHGPATIKDLSWWSSLTLADIRRGLAMVDGELRRDDIAGVAYWSSASAAAEVSSSPTVRLLQGYDEYIVGYSESKHILAPPVIGRSERRALFTGVVLVDGRVAGHWRRAPKVGDLIIEAALFAPLDRAHARALDAETERYGRFLGRHPSLVTTRL